MRYNENDYREKKGVYSLNLVLTERQCRVCQVRLTEYEIENNNELCMDCYKENREDTGTKTDLGKKPSL
jgi:hypothetical protein